MPDEPLIQRLWSMDVALHAIVVRVDYYDPRRRMVLNQRLDNMEHIAKATGGDVAYDPPEGSSRSRGSHPIEL